MNSRQLLASRPRGFWGWVARFLFLGEDDTASRAWRRVHIAVLVTAAVFMAGGMLLVRLEVGAEWGVFLSLLGPLFVAGGLSLVFLETVLSSQYGFPIPRETISRGLWANRRIITPLLALAVHLGTLFSPEALLLIRDFRSPWPIRVAALALLLICALPVWLTVFAPLRWWEREDVEDALEGEVVEEGV